MQTPLQIGLIGLGRVSEYQMQALAEMPDFNLTAACDLDPSKEALISGDIKFYTDYHQLLGSDIDAVLISTSNETHYEISKQAILHNKHVLVEKPAVLDPAQLIELEALANVSGVSLNVAYHAAFAKEMEWFLFELKSNPRKYGRLTGFQCLFFDPYVQEGKLKPQAIPLLGSWIDSGINALSVVERFLPIDQLKMKEARLSKVDGLNCSDLQASVDFTFPMKGTQRIGRGKMETNWTLDRNEKVTFLHFEDTSQSIILHHSMQQVILIDNKQTEHLLVDASEGKPRLLNHYLGVFADFKEQLRKKSANLDTSYQLHKLLYQPYGGAFDDTK